MPMAAFYIATKTAELVFAQAIEADLAPYGIGVSAIRPGFIATDLTADNKFPMPWIMSAERAARIVWNGIERGRFEIAFPFGMKWASWFRDTQPYFVFRWINLFLGRKAAQARALKHARAQDRSSPEARP
ncbi:MAG: SDR family NAD(P)-dependent oxidoreductase [Deltaproteobacteria bacterium]|nr:SDR family NAD(P)-dependent oxidoreductase [Deltaproteobacteria bacterium]